MLKQLIALSIVLLIEGKLNYLNESSNKHFHEISSGFYLKMVKKEIESKYLKGEGKLDFFNCIQHQMPSLIYG